MIGFKEKEKEVPFNEKLEEIKENKENVDDGEYEEYIVENEDSLMGVALKFDINMRVLININNLGEGKIYPNQVFLEVISFIRFIKRY